MYAIACSSGLIRLRSHDDGPKMDSALDGELRPVAVLNGFSDARLRACPGRSVSSNSIVPAQQQELPQVLQLRGGRGPVP